MQIEKHIEILIGFITGGLIGVLVFFGILLSLSI